MLIVRATDGASKNLDVALRLYQEGVKSKYTEAPCSFGRLFVREDGRCQRHESGDWTLLIVGDLRRSSSEPGGVKSIPITPAEVLNLYIAGGEEVFAELTSQFALVLANAATKELVLYLEPYGVESLFYRTNGAYAYIATETLPLAGIAPQSEFDRAALQDMAAFRFLSARRTPWQGVQQVLPGSCVRIAANGDIRERQITRFRITPSAPGPSVESEGKRTLAALKAVFRSRREEGLNAVAVPLSGGVDSSLLAALAAREFPNAIAFTARIEDFDNPELERACEVAKRVGIEHRIISVSSDDVKRLYPVILSRLQEPPRHYNNIVLARIYEEAARVAKIIISGEPGDTLFGSGGLPPIYREARKREFFELFPCGVQKLMASALQAMPMRRARSLGHIAKYTMDELLQQGDIVATGRIGKQVLRAWGDVEQLSAETIAIHDEREGDIYSRYQTIVLRTFIRANERRDVRLAEAFGASMFYPLLDPAVTEIATRLPEKLKFDPSIQISKRVLRWVCAELCGNDVAHWSKLGFPTPEQQWIEGPLRDAWETCQQENALVAPFLDRKHLPALISSGDYHPVWTVMTLNSILERMQQAKVATVTD